MPERFPIAPHGAKKDHEILDRTAEDRADENPERAGEKPELGGEDRADERAGAGDGGEVMAKNNPTIGFDEVLAVLVLLARRGTAVIEHEGAGRDPLGVEAVTDGVNAQCGDEEVGGIHFLRTKMIQAPQEANQKTWTGDGPPYVGLSAIGPD